MFRIAKTFSFSAAHSLPHLPAGHKCRNLHGHNYTVEVVCEVERLDVRGFAGLDYAEFGPFADYLRDFVDHGGPRNPELRTLDAILAPYPSTAEYLAAFLYGMAESMLSVKPACVRVCEVPGTWVEYRP